MDIFHLLNENLINYSSTDAPDRKILYKNYPSDTKLKKLIKYYIYFFKFGGNLVGEAQNDFFLEKIEKNPKFLEISDFEVEKIFGKFNFFGVICNIYWFYWSLYFFKDEGIDFNYLRFSECKFEMVGFFLERDGYRDFEDN